MSYVLLRTLFVMSPPSCLAWKGEEHRIQKTQTITTRWGQKNIQPPKKNQNLFQNYNNNLLLE